MGVVTSPLYTDQGADGCFQIMGVYLDLGREISFNITVIVRTILFHKQIQLKYN